MNEDRINSVIDSLQLILDNQEQQAKQRLEYENQRIERYNKLIDNFDNHSTRIQKLEQNSHPNRVFLVTIALILSFFAFIGTFFIYSLSTTKITPTIQSGGELNINSNNMK